MIDAIIDFQKHLSIPAIMNSFKTSLIVVLILHLYLNPVQSQEEKPQNPTCKGNSDCINGAKCFLGKCFNLQSCAKHGSMSCSRGNVCATRNQWVDETNHINVTVCVKKINLEDSCFWDDDECGDPKIGCIEVLGGRFCMCKPGFGHNAARKGCVRSECVGGLERCPFDKDCIFDSQDGNKVCEKPQDCLVDSDCTETKEKCIQLKSDKSFKCVKPASLRQSCTDDSQCQRFTKNSICDYSKPSFLNEVPATCQCPKGYKVLYHNTRSESVYECVEKDSCYADLDCGDSQVFKCNSKLKCEKRAPKCSSDLDCGFLEHCSKSIQESLIFSTVKRCYGNKSLNESCEATEECSRVDPNSECTPRFLKDPEFNYISDHMCQCKDDHKFYSPESRCVDNFYCQSNFDCRSYPLLEGVQRWDCQDRKCTPKAIVSTTSTTSTPYVPPFWTPETPIVTPESIDLIPYRRRVYWYSYTVPILAFMATAIGVGYYIHRRNRNRATSRVVFIN